MKMYAELKRLQVGIGVLVVLLGMAGSVLADVTFPNTFTNGTPALAEQVNQNFQAVNARQTATLARMAGVYTLARSQVTAPAGSTCVSISVDTLTLTAGGVITVSGNGRDSCSGNFSNNFSGTYTVASNGSGTISAGGAVLQFQASKDLNTVLIYSIGTGSSSQGTAVRN